METVTEFIIDLSGSMEQKIGLTKQILLSDIIPTLDYSSRIGIKSFSAVQGQPPIIQELPLSIVDKEAIIAAVNKLTVKKGGTPISQAIRQSVITLREYSASKKKIILVTDGEEDKGGDYVAECKKAQTEGINCEIHVVGIGLNAQAQSKAQEISKLTQGTYSYIPFTNGNSYNQTSIKASLSSFYAANAKQTPTPPPVSNTTSTSIPKAVTPVIEHKPETKQPEQPKIIVSDDSKEKDEILKVLVQEIKEIREELKKLRVEKAEVPEVVEDPELNESIRLISEKYLFEVLKSKYPNRVKWLNENGESNSDHDFEILEDDGTVEYYIECKGTAKQKTTFFVTKNEWKLFLNNTRNYQLYFIQNVFAAPSHVFISNVLDWMLKGKLLPYLKTRDIVKEERVFLTISDSQFV